MGRLATVQPNFVGVSLPSATGVNQALGAGQTVVLTEAEAVSAPVAALVTLGAVVLAAANSSPEPKRPQADKLAYANVNETQFTATTGGTVYVGSNVVTGPAAGVTYVPGFLKVAANQPKIDSTTSTANIIFPAYPGSGQVGNKTYSETSIVTNAPTVGAVSGGLTELNVFHTQGAVVSVAPTSGAWLNGDGSTNRTDATCGTTSASATVTDAAITAGDVGRSVSGAGIPAGSYVGTVTAGVSFTLVNANGTAATATATASVPLTFGSKTKVKWPAGTVPAFTTTVGAVDYFQFVTYDGGLTWVNTQTVKDVR